MGNIKSEAISGTYHQLAFTIWMVCFYWLPQQITRANEDQPYADNTLWSLILPYLTEKGHQSLIQYLGEANMKAIGTPFSTTMNELLAI